MLAFQSRDIGPASDWRLKGPASHLRTCLAFQFVSLLRKLITMLLERLDVVNKTPVSYCGSLEFDSQTKGRSLFRVFIGFYRRRDSVVGIAAGYGLDDRTVGVRLLVG
jgi:hypothetical protein